MYSNDDQLSTQIATALADLNVPYKIHQTPSNQPAIELSFRDDKYFNRQLAQWEDKERKFKSEYSDFGDEGRIFKKIE